MISLSTQTFDLNGRLVFRHARFQNQMQAERRGSVTATLDGGVWVCDTGYSVADQTWTATISSPSLAELRLLQYLVAYYERLVLCCEAGAFLARVSFQCNGGRLTLTARVLGGLNG